jgi:DamX protein
MATLSAALGALKRPPIPLPALLGLHAATGQTTRQEPFFFSSPLTSQRLALLKNIARRSSQVVVIIGERGSGKTTMLRQLIASADRSWQPVRLRLKSRRGGIGFGMGSCWPVWISRDAHPPAVIVDDAHRLSRLALKLLLKSALDPQGHSKVSTLILFAEPEIRAWFNDMARWLPHKAVIDKLYMSPLTEKQTDAYLRHRFKIAGFLPRHPFSPSQIRAIFQVSRGLPGWINGEAFMLLKRLYAGKRFRKPLLPWLSFCFDWRSFLAGRRLWARS